MHSETAALALRIACARCTLQEIDEVRWILLELREPAHDSRVVHCVHPAKSRGQHGELRRGDHVRAAERPQQIAHHLAFVETRTVGGGSMGIRERL